MSGSFPRNAAAVALAATAALALSAGPSDGGADRRDDRPCAMSGAVAINATTQGVVLRQRRGRRRGDVFGCLYRINRFYRVGIGSLPSSAFPGDRVGVPRIAGPFVAASQTGVRNRRATSQTIRVFDLRNGRVVHRYRERGQISVTDVELKASGSVAWIFRSRAGTRLHKIDRRHSIVDPGPVDPFSLAINNSRGTIIYWRNSDGPQSARLG